MKHLLLLCLDLLSYFIALTQFQHRAPGWRDQVSATTEKIPFSVNITLGGNKPEALRKVSVYSDSVFYYVKKKNQDSLLLFVQYFDSLGHTVEKDEFSDDGSLDKVTNFTYDDGALFKKEVVQRTGLREITVYDYDSSGNNTDEKLYFQTKEASKTDLVRINHKEYDSNHHVIKDNVMTSDGKALSYTEYSYDDEGRLTVTSTFKQDKSLLNSYFREYNEKKNSESIFLSNSSQDKKLIRESFFDDKKRLTKSYYYLPDRSFLDHSTEYFFYDSNGLLEKQSLEEIGGNHVEYFKYFYTIARPLKVISNGQ